MTRDEFMSFFRNDETLNTLSVEDRIEVFSSTLLGSSDFTKELLEGVLNDYCVDNLKIVKIDKTLNTIKLKAYDEFPEDLFEWAEGQYDDLCDISRNDWINGAEWVVEQLTDKLRNLHNQHEPDNQEQEKITIKCNLLMEIIKELKDEHT